MPEKGMQAVHITANLKNTHQPQNPTKAVQDWQAAVPGTYPTGTHYYNNEETSPIILGCVANTTCCPETPVSKWHLPQHCLSSHPLHLQGTFSVSTNHSVSSKSMSDWDKDGEPVLEESVIAAFKHDGMCYIFYRFVV